MPHGYRFAVLSSSLYLFCVRGLLVMVVLRGASEKLQIVEICKKQ